MNTETFFTLAEYKSNFERMKKEFVDAYIDNDEEEFIALQKDWYQRCIENTILEYGIVADSVGWDTKAMITGEGFIKVVDNKVRNERGGVIKEAAQNLNVSFKKILKYLKKNKSKILIKLKDLLHRHNLRFIIMFFRNVKLNPGFNIKLRNLKFQQKNME